MKQKRFLSHVECVEAAKKLALWINETAFSLSSAVSIPTYAVPRGGIPVAYLIGSVTQTTFNLVGSPEEACLIIDDLVDSGATRDRMLARSPKAKFVTLCQFLNVDLKRDWVVFPWENGDTDASADDIVTRLLQYVGEDPHREGLLETPQRVLRAWGEWTRGYTKDLDALFKTFEDGGEGYDEMVMVKDLPFYSHCEHHLAPFFGTATIAYLPNKRIVGLSKLGRVLDAFSKRLQVQERLTTQLADTIAGRLDARGVGVLLKARHLCMESRGLAQQGHTTTTSALRGCFRDGKCRDEFLSLANG